MGHPGERGLVARPCGVWIAEHLALCPVCAQPPPCMSAQERSAGVEQVPPRGMLPHGALLSEPGEGSWRAVAVGGQPQLARRASLSAILIP